MKGDKLYLIYINECIERIEKYASGGKDTFLTSSLIQDAVLRNLQTLSESTQRLSDVLKKAHTEVKWRNYAGLRNLLVHDYLGLDMNYAWAILEKDLPDLKEKIAFILQEPSLY